MPHICSVLEDSPAYLAYGIDHLRLPMAPRVIRGIILRLQGNEDIGLDVYHPVGRERSRKAS